MMMKGRLEDTEGGGGIAQKKLMRPISIAICGSSGIDKNIIPLQINHNLLLK